MRAEGELDPAHYLDPVSRVETQLMPSRDQAGQTIVADPPTDVKHGDQPSNDEHLDRQTERRLVRRIDLILMPLLTIAYGLQFLDKAVLGELSRPDGSADTPRLGVSLRHHPGPRPVDDDQRRRLDNALFDRQRRCVGDEQPDR